MFRLEPYSDNSLPGYDIRKGLLEALQSFPIETYHLKESGLGRTIKMLSRSNGETKENKKKCMDLMYQWRSMVLGTGGAMDYRALAARSRQKGRGRGDEEDEEDEGEDLEEDEEDEERGKRQKSTGVHYPKVPPSANAALRYHQPQQPSAGSFSTGSSGTSGNATNTPEKYRRLLGHMQKLKAPKTRRF